MLSPPRINSLFNYLAYYSIGLHKHCIPDSLSYQLFPYDKNSAYPSSKELCDSN